MAGNAPAFNYPDPDPPLDLRNIWDPRVLQIDPNGALTKRLEQAIDSVMKARGARVEPSLNLNRRAYPLFRTRAVLLFISLYYRYQDPRFYPFCQMFNNVAQLAALFRIFLALSGHFKTYGKGYTVLKRERPAGIPRNSGPSSGDHGCVITRHRPGNGCFSTLEGCHILPHSIANFESSNTIFLQLLAATFGQATSEQIYNEFCGHNVNRAANLISLTKDAHSAFDDGNIELKVMVHWSNSVYPRPFTASEAIFGFPTMDASGVNHRLHLKLEHVWERESAAISNGSLMSSVFSEDGMSFNCDLSGRDPPILPLHRGRPQPQMQPGSSWDPQISVAAFELARSFLPFHNFVARQTFEGRQGIVRISGTAMLKDAYADGYVQELRELGPMQLNPEQ